MDARSEVLGTRPWDGFLIGPENALAHASVLALARGDEPGLSPLVVHGPSGVGKSRLLAGLVAEWLSRYPESVVTHLQAETFASLCAEAVNRPGGWSELRSRFRTVQLFILEDLHALEHAPLALNELCHTLDALHETGATVAFSARTAPAQSSHWPERLVNRLLGGLSVRVELPGLASRRRYLLERARARGVALAAEAVETITETADGYRMIDGLLVKLALNARVAKQPINAQTVLSALTDDGTQSGRVSIERVAQAVAVRFGVRLSDLRSSSRRVALTVPRHLAILLSRRWTGLSFALIGQYFGKRDPATIRHACQAAAERLEADPALLATANTLESAWRTGDKAG